MALLMLLSWTTLNTQQAHSQGAAKTKVFVSTVDFPPDIFFEHPIPPAKETRFWQLLDKNFRERSNMELTENLEEANYRVNLECSGIVWCTNVKVYLMSPHRDMLATYSLTGRPMMFPPNLSLFTKRLTETLNYRIDSLDQGGMGTYGLTRYRYKYTGGPKRVSRRNPAPAPVSTPVVAPSETQ